MELLVVLAMIAILLGLAIPDPGAFLDDNRLRAGSSDFVTSMQISRAEAVGRNAATTLCKRNSDGTDCTTSGGWQQGWLVFVDADRDATVDAGEEVVQLHDALHSKISFHGTTGVVDFITFRANGRTSVASTQVLILCDQRGFGTDAKGLVISILGRASAMAAPDTGQSSCLVPGS